MGSFNASQAAAHWKIPVRSLRLWTSSNPRFPNSTLPVLEDYVPVPIHCASCAPFWDLNVKECGGDMC